MSKEDGGSAFPRGRDDLEKGMTLRDYFAAKAMQAIMGDATLKVIETDFPEMVRSAYLLADAMIAERAKP